MERQRITSQLKEHAQYPDICLVGDVAYVAYQVCREDKDDIEVMKIGGKNQVVYKSGSVGEAFMPSIIGDGEKLHLSFSEYRQGKWYLYLVSKGQEGWGEKVLLDEGTCIFRPSMVVHQDRLWVFYTKFAHRPQAVSRYIEDGTPSEEIGIHPQGESYRPTGAVGGDGRLYISFDVFNGKSYEVYGGVLERDKFKTIPIPHQEAFASSTCVAPTSDGALIMWSEILERSQQNYSSAQVRWAKDQIEIGPIDIHLEGNTWILYQGVDPRGKYGVFNNSRQILLRKRLKSQWDAGFEVEKDGLTVFRRRPKCILDDKGNIHIVYQKSKGNGHTWTRNAEIIYITISEDEYEKGKDPGITGVIAPFNRPVEKDKDDKVFTKDQVKAFMETGLKSYKGYFPYWGDIHGQSQMSDGLGEVDQYYNYALAKTQTDFTALTDHDCFPDLLSPAEWAFIKTHCKYFNTEKLTTLHAYEWTSNEFRYDYGHKNVYYRDQGPFIPCVSDEGYSPDALYEALRPYEALTIPHHVGAVWDVVLASTDWKYHDEDLQRVAEVLSRHAVFETDKDRSPYTKNVPREEGNSLRHALKRGYRIGFVGGSDSHQLEAGTEGGLTCVYAKAKDRASIFDNIKERNTLATTGARILAQFEIKGHRAGSEIKVRPGEIMKIKAHIWALTGISKVEIIKNGLPVFEYKGSGDKMDLCEQVTFKGDSWYYLRILLEDDHLALVSPIWIDELK